MSVETIEKSFSCPDSPSLSLSNIRGSVKIHPGDDGVIAIVAVKHLGSGEEENTSVEMSQSDDGSVEVKTRYDHKGIRFFRSWIPCKVDYKVSVPKDCSLKVRGVSNSTRIEDISGKFDISTVSGELELSSLSGEIRLRTVGGDVQGEAIFGPTRLDTVSGDINLKKSDIPVLKGKTVSGDLVVETPLGDGPYNFKAVSGDIELVIAPLRGATITSSSLSGNIRTSLEPSYTNHFRNHHKIDLEGGGVEIHHKSVSGDLFLVSGNKNGAPRNVEDMILDEDRPQTRTDILEQVDRGELSVEQALQMFKGESV